MIRVDLAGVEVSLTVDAAIRLCGMLLLRVREQDQDRVLRWLDLQEQAYAQYHHPESEPPIVVADAPIEPRAVRMVREDLGWRLLTEAEADQQRERNLDDIMGTVRDAVLVMRAQCPQCEDSDPNPAVVRGGAAAVPR